MASVNIILIGTCDTKLAELLYIRNRMIKHYEQANIILIDVGRNPVEDSAISIPQQDIVTKYLKRDESHHDLSQLPRSEVMARMTQGAIACVQDLKITPGIHGIVSIGGSNGTSLAAAVMRESLPFTVPKIIVSTMASGDTSSFVGEHDITMMYSIVDIAGSNKILNSVLDNAAGATLGMALAYKLRMGEPENNLFHTDRKTRVGITMFGVTTPCVDAMRHHLTHKYGYEAYVFHATGHGGKAMERMIMSGELDAVLDLTTTEIADEVVGGVLSAGPHRLEAAAKAGVPQVISVGACDMVNFGPRSTVPERFAKGGRNLYEHNSSVTLMRTSAEECREIGKFIVSKLKGFCFATALVQVVLPMGGLSMLSTPGGPYHDREADEALFNAIEVGLEGEIEVFRDERDINDQSCAIETADRLARLINLEKDLGN